MSKALNKVSKQPAQVSKSIARRKAAGKIYLKNVSDTAFTFEMTEHPISQPTEFSYRDGEVNKKGEPQPEVLDRSMRRSPGLRDRLSDRYEFTFEPGETQAFGESEELNLEHARYIYASFGGYAEQYAGGPMIEFPVIEVDAEGNEITDNLQAQFRAKRSASMARPSAAATHAQFQLPPAEQERLEKHEQENKERQKLQVGANDDADGTK